MNNRRKFLGICAAVLVAAAGVGGAGYQINQNRNGQDTSQVQSTDANTHETSGTHSLAQEIEEELGTEEIVVKITEDGYITTNGGHFHFHKGPVPDDAILSEELLVSLDQVNRDDIIGETADSYIVKVGNDFRLVAKDPSNLSSFRSLAQIQNQQKQVAAFVNSHRSNRAGGSHAGRTLYGGRRVGGRYTTDDGYVFSPYDVIDDLGDGYLVPHDDHFHFIPKSDLSASELAAAQQYWAGITGRGRGGSGRSVVSSPSAGSNRGQVHSGSNNVSADKGWQAVRERYIQAGNSQASGSSQESGLGLNSGYNQRQTSGWSANSGQSGPDRRISSRTGGNAGQAQAASNPLTSILQDLYQIPVSNERGKRQTIQNTRHVEGDGLVFDPLEIERKTNAGYVIPHGDHYHLIPFDWLSPLEIAASEMVLEARDRGEKIPSYQEVLAGAQTQALAQVKSERVGDHPSQKQPPRLEEKKAPETKAQASQNSATSQAQKPVGQNQPAKSDQKPETVAIGPFGPVGTFAPDGQTAATPLADRYGKPNAQIVYSKQEVAVAKDAGHYTTTDGYIFDAGDIQSFDGSGYVTGHMNHIHYIPHSDLNPEEQAAAISFINEKDQGQPAKGTVTETTQASSKPASQQPASQTQGQGPDKRASVNQPANTPAEGKQEETNQAKPADTQAKVKSPESEDKPAPASPSPSQAQELLDRLYQLPESSVRGRRPKTEGSRHVEGDGLVFDPVEIEGKTPAGYVIPHGDHYHLIPQSWLNDLEISAAEAVLAERAGRASQPKLGKQGQEADKSVVQDEAPVKPDLTFEKATVEPIIPALQTQEPIIPSLPAKEEAGQDQIAEKEIEKTRETSKQVPEAPAQPEKTEEKKASEAKDQASQEGAYGPVGELAPDGGPATPLKEREGKKNSQIVYSKEEVEFAKQNGIYTTSDGYIFDAGDIQEEDGSGVITRHMDHIHYIPYKDLSAQELEAAKAFLGHRPEVEKQALGQGQTLDQDQEFDPSSFDPKEVFAKIEKDGQIGYAFKQDGQDAFAPASHLDLQDRAFAEEQLNLNSNLTYVYDIAPAKEGELEPGLYVPVSQLPMRAGSASVDTGEFFVVPHIDHLHLVYYKDLSPEQIATIKYLMQHPNYRPAPWTDAGHDVTTENAIKYIPNVTPVNERVGMKNYQIIHSAQEVNKALAEGNYATDEGYIFNPSDLLLDETYVYKSDNSWAIPRANGGRLMAFSKKQVPASMHASVDEVLSERDRLAAEKAKKEVSNRQLMDFLADHYGVGKRAVRFNFWDSSFSVPFDDAPNIDITKDQALKAYFEEGDLPTKASPVQASPQEEPKQVEAAKEEAPPAQEEKTTLETPAPAESKLVPEKPAETQPEVIDTNAEPQASESQPNEANDDKSEADKLSEELYKLPESEG